ncbi:MAG: hypothetical protein IJN27_01695 [Oscillospiraceae bacterium]|nr:hypothetical protein [Oscillospiraceae bacterium]
MPRTSNGNLKVPTSEEARINGAKGGKASAEARKEKKRLQESLNKLLSCKIDTDNLININEDFRRSGIDTSKMKVADLLALAQVLNGIKGSQGAFCLIRDSIGEKPVEEQKINVSEIPKITIARKDN